MLHFLGTREGEGLEIEANYYLRCSCATVFIYFHSTMIDLRTAIIKL